MLVEDSQCAAYVTEFGSRFVNTTLYAVQGMISFLSIVGSVLLILTYVLLKPLRTKSRLLITHLAVANFLITFPNFLAVFMNFSTRFKVPSVVYSVNQSTDTYDLFNISESLPCSGNIQFFHNSEIVYCSLCVYLGFVSLVGVLSNIFWSVCVCIHFFILISYRNTKLASHIAYAYYVIAWVAPLGICLWLLFHNWLGFEPAYSTVNCGIKADCVPHHHPYHYQNSSYTKSNWNRGIGVLFGIKIWQVSVFLIIPCLFVAIRCKKRKHLNEYDLFTSSPIRSVERKILLIPLIFMLISTASFVSDLYFFINHGKNLRNLRSSDGGIIFVHFLIRICDNSQGVINFCLFCLFTKEVRSATSKAIKQLCHSQSTSNATVIPGFRSSTELTPSYNYGAVNSQVENPLNPSMMLN